MTEGQGARGEKAYVIPAISSRRGTPLGGLAPARLEIVDLLQQILASRWYAKRMSEQVAVRIPEAVLEGLDELVAAGRYNSRAAALRAGMDLVLRLERERAIQEEYRAAYADSPEEGWVGAAGLVLGAQLVSHEVSKEGRAPS